MIMAVYISPFMTSPQDKANEEEPLLGLAWMDDRTC